MIFSINSLTPMENYVYMCVYNLHLVLPKTLYTFLILTISPTLPAWKIIVINPLEIMASLKTTGNGRQVGKSKSHPQHYRIWGRSKLANLTHALVLNYTTLYWIQTMGRLSKRTIEFLRSKCDTLGICETRLYQAIKKQSIVEEEKEALCTGVDV